MKHRAIHNTQDARTDLVDHAALAGAFLIGVAGVVGLKALQVGPWIAVVFPVAVLLAYALICFAAGRLMLEPETVGDNCYYLGFLFTLASLSVSLYQMRAVTGTVGADLLIPTVISGFGIALSSTIAGVFLRIMLMQMRPDLVAMDREVRRDMQAAMRDMRADMGTASRAFRALAIESAQRAAERDAEFSALDDRPADTSLIAELRQIEAARAKRDAALLAAIQRLGGESTETRHLERVGQ